MKIFGHGAALVLAFLVFGLTSQADEKKFIEKKPADKEPATEQEFLAKAISADIAEVKLGELALKHALSSDVKKFARTMIDDHAKHRDALLERAKAIKLGVVQGLEKEYQEKVDRLAKLDGKEFDREYMHCMVEGHEKVLKMYQNWSKKVEGKDFSSLVDRTITAVKEHLEHARELHNKLKS